MRVVLTFDAEHPDGPNCPPTAAEQILAVLRHARVRATFFLQGRWAEAYPHLARDIALGGHRVGNHSFYHARMTLLSDDGAIADILDADRVIRTATGADPKPWFRCPWGECANDSRILRSLADLGYRHVGWDVEAGEWDAARTPREVEDAVVSGALAAGDGAIVLLHTWPASVPAALPGIIHRLRDAGREFVTLDDLTSVAPKAVGRSSRASAAEMEGRENP